VNGGRGDSELYVLSGLNKNDAKLAHHARQHTKQKRNSSFSFPPIQRNSAMGMNCSSMKSLDVNEDADEKYRNSRRNTSKDSLSSRSLVTVDMNPREGTRNPQYVATSISYYTNDMQRLEDVVQSPEHRHDLIEQLLSLRGDSMVKVRFMHVVDQFDAASNIKERKRLAEIIINTFINGGGHDNGIFKINVESDTARLILHGNHLLLLKARREILEELSLNKEVMKIVERIEKTPIMTVA
jgi:hypothetical protein